MNVVDKFVVYDNIEFTKNSWIRRNRILVEGRDKYITLPIKNDSDYLNIDQRELTENHTREKDKIFNQIASAYRAAPEYDKVIGLVEEIIKNEEVNLFAYIYNSILKISDYLEIEADIIISSEVAIDHNLKAQDKVLAICKELETSKYYNAIGGLDLYSADDFAKEDIELKFIKTNEITYKQFNNDFIPNLSIIDVMMFNKKEKIIEMLDDYKLIQKSDCL